MVIFIDNPKMVEMIGNKFNKKICILNLSSFYSGYMNITNLITNIRTPENSGINPKEYVDSYEFDAQYANNILNDPFMFKSLLEIVQRAYNGFIVCILVQRDLYRDSVMESLIKLLQQRYEINSWIVESVEDIEVIEDDFILYRGLYSIDEDIKKYNYMVNNSPYGLGYIINPECKE